MTKRWSVTSLQFRAGRRFREAIGQFGQQSFAQLGEDIIASFILETLGIVRPTYLDIGAHHPWKYNNTALFYQRGCRGINVDANAERIKLFERERPEDTNLAVGVGAQPDSLQFFVMQEETLSTFSEREAHRYRDECGIAIKEVRQVPVVTASSIIEQYGERRTPDFVSIDVEGLEDVAIKSLALDTWRPAVFCVETITFSPDGRGAKRPSAIALLEASGYLVFADTYVNTILVDGRRWKP